MDTKHRPVFEIFKNKQLDIDAVYWTNQNVFLRFFEVKHDPKFYCMRIYDLENLPLKSKVLLIGSIVSTMIDNLKPT